MPGRDLQDQLVKYLTDVHSIEEQALAQTKRRSGACATCSRPRSSPTRPESSAAERIAGHWDQAVEASLAQVVRT
jgi:hypothetical protein